MVVFLGDSMGFLFQYCFYLKLFVPLYLLQTMFGLKQQFMDTVDVKNIKKHYIDYI